MESFADQIKNFLASNEVLFLHSHIDNFPTIMEDQAAFRRLYSTTTSLIASGDY